MSNNSELDIIGYLLKVSRTLFWGLLWIFANSIAGIYFEMAFRTKHSLFVNIIFYIIMIISLFVLLRYYSRQWRKE